MDIISKIWQLFWSIWPKNFILLIIISALSEVASVSLFRFGGNRGWLAVLGYVVGFLAIAFYGEGQKYSTLSVSYPLWIGAVAVLVSLSAFLIFHDQFSVRWLVGFVLTVIGVFLIQTAIPE